MNTYIEHKHFFLFCFNSTVHAVTLFLNIFGCLAWFCVDPPRGLILIEYPVVLTFLLLVHLSVGTDHFTELSGKMCVLYHVLFKPVK